MFKEKHEWRPFGISYRALVPKAGEAVNVLTATCPSSSHVGYGTYVYVFIHPHFFFFSSLNLEL